MILCCGEALIDMLPCQSRENDPAFTPCVGGAAFNTAVALGRQGMAVSLFSGLSDDFMGDMLRHTLDASGVDYSPSTRAPLPTTLAFVRLVGGQARYTFYDENSAGRMLRESDLPELGDDVAAVLFGCISLIAEPCGSVYETLMAREAPRRVMYLDPNIREIFIADRQKHLARMIALADIVKLSDEDLAWFAEPGEEHEVIRRWLVLGPKLIVVTRGADGADAWTADFHLHVPAIHVAVADTVGAGDTVNAGILASLSQAGLLEKEKLVTLSREQVRRAVDLGMRAAAVTVSRPGANPPWDHELRSQQRPGL